MTFLVRRAYEIYRQEGLKTLSTKVLTFLRRRLRPLLFGIQDRIRDVERDAVLITTRGSTIGADSLALIMDIPRLFGDRPVYLAVGSLSNYEKEEPLSLDRFSTDIRVIERHSKKFIKAIQRAGLVCSMSQEHVRSYRRIQNRDDRICIRIHHGVMTKAYGNLRSEEIIRRSPHSDQLTQYPNGFDVQSVSSDVELLYRACAEGRHPVAFRKYGYPRFDRIDRLIAGTSTPILPLKTQRELETNSEVYRILYAPTHKDNDVTTLFPFSDSDITRLREFLTKHRMELFIRMHPIEEDSESYDEIIDGETIKYAGRDFSSASSEILPFFDALVTDYSSIYADFLPFDRPIIFVKDDFEGYGQKRGLAFDYDRYFPGKKVETQETFMRHLRRCQDGRETFDDQREFVRQTFLPDRELSFLEHVTQDFNQELKFTPSESAKHGCN